MSEVTAGAHKSSDLSGDRLAFHIALAQTLESQATWRLREAALQSSDGLPALLHHACATVPYFQSSSICAADAPASLRNFPLISREHVASQRFAFVSTQVKSTETPLFARTSGSTGPPLTVRFGAAEWYALNQVSYRRIADAFPLLGRLARPGQLAVAMIYDGANRETTDTLLFELNYSVFSRLVLRYDRTLDTEWIHGLRAVTVPLLYGKPTNLLKLAHLDANLDRSSERIRPGLLLTSGENLYGDQRKELQARYGCPLVNAYTSVEGGLIGLQCSLSDVLHVDPTCSVIEVLTSSGELRAEGEGEFVLTNLWNWTMPFIRYRTGDHGVLRTQHCRCGRTGQTIVRLDGREVGRFATTDRTIDSQQLDSIFDGFGVQRFQLEQQSDTEFELRWETAGVAEDDVQMWTEKASQRLRERLGDVRVNILRVEATPKQGFKPRRYFSPLSKRGAPSLPAVVPRTLHASRTESPVLAVEPSAERLAVANTCDLEIVGLLNDDYSIRIETAGHVATCLQFSPVDNMLVCGNANRTVTVWDLRGSGRQVGELETEEPPVRLAFSYDGTIVVSGGVNGGLQAWQLGKGAASTTVAAGNGPTTALATSSVSRLVASASRSAPRIEVRTLPDLECISEIPISAGVNALAFMVDENVLGVGCEDGRIELWNVDTHAKIAEFHHSAAISAVAFCQSRLLLVAGNTQGEIRAWQVWRAQQKAQFCAHASAVTGIAFLTDRYGYVTVANDAAVRLWPLDSDG